MRKDISHNLRRRLAVRWLFPAVLLLLAAGPFLVRAYDYTPLESSSMFICSGGATGCFYNYLTGIYGFFIGTAGIAAMGLIIWGGIQYFFSAGNVAKAGDGKEMITNALFGLFIVMVSYMLLYVINPDLVTISGISNMSNFSTPFYAPASNPTQPPAAPVDDGADDLKNCGMFGTQAGISSQCSDASNSLETMLECMKGQLGSNYSKYRISSISDSQGLDNCRNDTGQWKRPPCAHSQSSCHYNRQTGESESHAVDFSYRGLNDSDKSALKSAASSCGGTNNDEGNHLHISDSGCGT